MDTKIQFQKNAAVVAANGEQLGSLQRIVVNPTNNVLTNIVIRTGALLNREEKVVPIDLVAQTTEKQIVLQDRLESLESLPVFEERRIVDGEINADPSRSIGDTPIPLFGRPDLGIPYVVTPASPEMGEEFVTQIEQNIPIGTVAIKEGANVITAEGKHAGNLESIFTDSSMDQIIYMLVSNGLLTKEMKLLPFHWVTLLGEDEIHLWVNKSSVDKLADISAEE